MIKIVGYLFLFYSFTTHALVPVEGILMGEAKEEIQSDPLLKIFSDIYDKSQMGQNKKVKLYQATFESGQNLFESCSYLTPTTYSSSWDEKQARRNIAATLQYIGLDTTIKAIGAYAKKMDVNNIDFQRLTKNLVTNYCSKNITVMSIRNIEKSLGFYYYNPLMTIIPSIESSPFATTLIKISSEKTSARSKEFDLILRNFRAFCSWGGEVEDYRMMTSYLNNRFIMAFVIKNILGVQDQIDDKSQKVTTISSLDTAQVACKDLICRKTSTNIIRQEFPLSIGSTGLYTDLSKIYCHHFRYQDSPKTEVPEVKTWLKQAELEDPIFETSQLIALMTGVPDLFNGAETYLEIPLLVKSSIDERWNIWSKNVLSTFSHDLLYEESLKVKVEPKRTLASLSKGFLIHFNITVGEIDRLLASKDKLNLTFELKLSKNYLRSIRTKWAILEKEVDNEGKKKFQQEIADYINLQLKQKEKLFSQKVWNEDFSNLIADELVQQIIIYRGPLFDSYQEQILVIPVKFSYGLFAIGYLRYRSDLASRRLKLNL